MHSDLLARLKVARLFYLRIIRLVRLSSSRRMCVKPNKNTNKIFWSIRSLVRCEVHASTFFPSIISQRTHLNACMHVCMYTGSSINKQREFMPEVISDEEYLLRMKRQFRIGPHTPEFYDEFMSELVNQWRANHTGKYI